MLEQGDFVPIEGQLVEVTQLGVFLFVQSRRIFVGTLCLLQMPDRRLQPGETVTLDVSRHFVEREGLVA